VTFSLLGRCPATGQLGAAVTTSDIAVGARVPWAAAEVGAVVTQNRTDPRLGPLLLDALRVGIAPAGAVMRTIEAHPHPDWRQLGVLDAGGNVGHFTGERAGRAAGAAPGPDCLAVGNMLTNDAVLPAIASGFTAADGELAGRLIAGLRAGQRAGGETAPLRSAAVLVVERESFPLVDLRVDDAAEPLDALDALWRTYAPWARTFVARALDPDDADRVHRSSSTTT
jgi:uncharacterized Ntn-hydrolase superfamily protein